MTTTPTRVRFAPSPTGYLHIGGARTALFNWLLARKHGGSFILRIEDTDQGRHVADSLDKILADMRWLGLNWDEGPEVGGDTGPYFQSERLDTYRHYTQQLLERGLAYYAMETSEELAALRAQFPKDKGVFRYPRPDPLPTVAQGEAARAAGRPVVVRFKMPGENIIVRDVILGDVELAGAELEDFVIQKGDGWPTYHFACVVDDELMGVTHVLRGQEHLINTPKHVAMQRALGFRTPVYAHLPVIFNMNGTKMSKRDKGASLTTYMEEGYLPAALVNYLCLLGWSPKGNREKMALAEVVEAFDLPQILRHNARFDLTKLIWLNGEYLRELGDERFYQLAAEALTRGGLPLDKFPPNYVRAALETCKGKVKLFGELPAYAGFYFKDDIQYDAEAVQKDFTPENRPRLARLREALAALEPFEPDPIGTTLKAVAQGLGVKAGVLVHPTRLACCGNTAGPSLYHLLAILGKARALARMDKALARIGSETAG